MTTSAPLPANEQNFDRLGAELGRLAGAWRELVITRHIAAPRPLLWRRWTEPALLAEWWGPKGFTNPVCEVDPCVGGALRIVMRAPDGTDYPMQGSFREIVAPERLVFTNRAVALAPPASRMLEGMEAGWTQSLDRLAQAVTAPPP
jgi:uncharacterized protein YndB with AHSA1/START domain